MLFRPIRALVEVVLEYTLWVEMQSDQHINNTASVRNGAQTRPSSEVKFGK
jgi:hypothetical protein